MKKIILILFVLVSSKCYAALFGVSAEYVKNKTTEIKTSLQNEIVGVKGDISGIKNTMRDLNMKIGNINTELQAKITGLDNSVSTKMSAGRDANSNSGNTNDSALMKFIFSKIIYVIGLIIGLVGTLIASYERLLRQKDKWIADVEKRNSEKQEKLDDWQNKFIEKLSDRGVV